MSECVFCRIVAGEIPARKIYDDDHVLAFHDLHPQAPVHALVIPRRHVASLHDARSAEEQALLGRLLVACCRVAEELGVDQAYRVVTNRGAGAGQSVFHLHFHLLGGRPLGWPPG